MSMSLPVEDQFQPLYEPPGRPTSVTVIAIVGIVIGALGLLCTGGGTLWSFSTDPNVRNMTPPMLAYSLAAVVMGVLLSVMMVIGSVGLLHLRPWSRTLMLVVAMLDLIFDLAKLLTGLLWYNPLVLQVMKTNPPPDLTPEKVQEAEPIIRATMIGVSVLTFLITGGVAVAILIVLTRPRVKAVFDKPEMPRSF